MLKDTYIKGTTQPYILNDLKFICMNGYFWPVIKLRTHRMLSPYEKSLLEKITLNNTYIDNDYESTEGIYLHIYNNNDKNGRNNLPWYPIEITKETSIYLIDYIHFRNTNENYKKIMNSKHKAYERIKEAISTSNFIYLMLLRIKLKKANDEIGELKNNSSPNDVINEKEEELQKLKEKEEEIDEIVEPFELKAGDELLIERIFTKPSVQRLVKIKSIKKETDINGVSDNEVLLSDGQNLYNGDYIGGFGGGKYKNLHRYRNLKPKIIYIFGEDPNVIMDSEKLKQKIHVMEKTIKEEGKKRGIF